MKLKKIFILSAFLFLNTILFAQNANIRGFVYEKETGEPSIFTSVILAGTKYGVQTDVNGYFSITKLPAGNYNLKVVALGFDTIFQAVSVKDGEIKSLKLFAKKGSIALKEVSISADKQEATTEVRTSVNKITPKEIKQIPTVGGEPDLAQYLQVVPGVVFTGDQGGQLYIRGGSPVQNKVLMDGMIIYNPFHSIGLFSVFDADIIRNADVYTGGFNAEYGGRISSIMDITTRDGNKKRLSGKVAISPFGAKTLIEGPLVKSKEEGGGSTSFLLSAKNSYLSQSSKALYSYINPEGLPFDFLDLYGKVSINGNNGSKLNVFGFNFMDSVKYQAISNLKWTSAGAGANFVVIPSSSQILIRGNFAYSKYGISMAESQNQPRSSSIDGFNLGLNFTYFTGKNELIYGVELLGTQTTFDFYNAYNRKISNADNNTEFAGFMRYKANIGDKLILDPSFRLHYYASLGEASPEPRIGFKYNVVKHFRLKGAAGLYSQNLISANSDRDVVNLFYGFISGPENVQTQFTNQKGETNPIKSRLQKSTHLIAGFELDLFRDLTLNVEAYNKKFGQLTNINRNKKFDDNSLNSDRLETEKKDFIIESGYARGIDFSLKYEHKRIYLWAVYSLSYVKRWDGVQEYFPLFDRRHNVNLTGSYTFGRALDWELNARWNLGSGFAFTQNQGFYQNFDFANGINTDITTSNGQLGIIYGDLNTGRLPYYHRLDLTVKKKFELTENSTLELNAGATNMYNRKNVFYVDRVKGETVYQLPLMPTIGASLNF